MEMRLLVYNIRYGTGGRKLRFPWSGYLGRTAINLSRITDFMKEVNPDIAGLLEVDAGSYRSHRQNQASTIASELGHYHSYASKYHSKSKAHFLPVMNKQGNAFLARDTITNETFHYFERGVKRLVIELETEEVTVFLVHLALGFRVRHQQLSDLYALVKETTKPHIVAGDFNAMWGDKEIRLFLAATGLRNANVDGEKSFPSWAPKRELDFVLHSPGIQTERFHMPKVVYSDHLPLVYDFSISG
jgi:endonuclease/exonuclease/phosphatase family metal-dependent hydrolase